MSCREYSELRNLHGQKPCSKPREQITPISNFNIPKCTLLSDEITFPGSLALANYTLRD